MLSGGAGAAVDPSSRLQGHTHSRGDAASSTGAPAMQTSYSPRMSFAGSAGARDASGGEGMQEGPPADLPMDGDVFTSEDRMLLRMLYHQQQAIQMQLNTMTEWMQQVSYRIASLDRLSRLSRNAADSAISHSSAKGGNNSAISPATAAAPSLSRSVSVADRYGSATSIPLQGSQFQVSPAAALRGAEASQAQRGLTPTNTSTGNNLLQANTSVQAVSTVLEDSRACTPPSADLRRAPGGVGSSRAAPSTALSYESAMAQPWDPHGTSVASSVGGAVHSRTSSHMSALGRGANPLLHMSNSLNKLPASTLGVRPKQADPKQQLARLDTSVISGTGRNSSSGVTSFDTQQTRHPPVVSPPASSAAAFTSSPGYASVDVAVPPFRRVPADSMGRVPLSRATAVPTTSPPPAAVHSAPSNNTQTGGSLGPSGREATQPPAPGYADEVAVDARGERERSPVAERQVEKALGAGTGRGSNSTEVHRDPAGVANSAHAREAAVRSRGKLRPSSMSNDDSLSDGYGSYESRRYMKSLGLL